MALVSKTRAGFQAIQQGKLDEALEAFEEAIGQNGQDWEAWLGLARIRLSKGDEDSARPAYEKVLALNAGNAEAQSQLALIRSHQGDPRAVDDLIALTQAKDANFYAYFNLGKVLSAKKDWKGASEAFEKALRLEPKSPFPHVELAQIAIEQNDTARAVAHFRQAADVDPTDWEPLYYLARARIMRGEVGQAAIDILEALDRSPHNKRLRADLVKVCIAAGNTKGALMAGEKLFSEFPDDADALHLYGVSLLTAGQLPEARQALQEAMNRAGGTPLAAEIKQTLGEIERALSAPKSAPAKPAPAKAAAPKAASAPKAAAAIKKEKSTSEKRAATKHGRGGSKAGKKR